MSSQSRLVAGILLILLPTVEFGGASLLSLLMGDPQYTQNELRQDLWRAGHAHAGVWLVLCFSGLALRGRDGTFGGHEVVSTPLPAGRGNPIARGLLPLGPLPRGEGTQRADLPRLHRGVVLAVGLLALGIGLIRGRRRAGQPT